jgi:transcriptional regulator with XRE-family HTH domain
MANKVSARQAEQIGACLKAARERRGETLQAVSGPTGVNYSQLSRIERGGFRTISKNVQKICTFFEISVTGVTSTENSFLGLADRAARVAAQSAKNQRVLEAVLSALDDNH